MVCKDFFIILPDLMSPAFNAALVLFGIVLVYKHPTWSTTQSAAQLMHLVASFDAAIEALRNLDPGNRLVNACCQHLQQLSHVLNVTRKPPNLNPLYVYYLDFVI